MDLIIDRRINFSSPDCLEQVFHLRSQLNKALDILSGIQQPPMSTDSEAVFDEWEERSGEGTRNVRRVADEIFLALTGEKVVNTCETHS